MILPHGSVERCPKCNALRPRLGQATVTKAYEGAEAKQEVCIRFVPVRYGSHTVGCNCRRARGWILTEYYHPRDCQKCFGRGYTWEQDDEPLEREHLAFVCVACGYRWKEECADAHGKE